MRLNVQVIKYEQSISIRIYVNRCGCCESWEWGVNRLEYLSQFSNAVLSPELNTCEIPKPKHELRWADEFEFRQDWCKQQIESIGEFGAVLGGGV